VGSSTLTCWRFRSSLGARRGSSSAGCRLGSTRQTGSRSRRSAPARARYASAYAKGIFRVRYVAKFEEAVYVLLCFQKKTQATSKQDKDIAATRYRAVVNARKGKR
jgi:Phage derived protein Gp49-like (DUF891)